MSDDAYGDLLRAVEQAASRLDRDSQASLLFELLGRALARVELETQEIEDDQELQTPEAIVGSRAAARGASVDLDAIHDHLTRVALLYSEDQDIELHMVSQSALAIAAWLRLASGRRLRARDDVDDGLDAFTQIVELLAWTYAGQLYTRSPDPTYDDLPAVTRALADMYQTIVERSR